MVRSRFKRVMDNICWLPFMFILALIGYAFVITIQVHIAYTLQHKHAVWSSILNIVIGMSLCGMTVWCFLVATFKDPGRPKGAGEGMANEWQQGSHATESRWAKQERLREQRQERLESMEDDYEDDVEGHNSGDEAPLMEAGARDRFVREDPTTAALDGGADLVPGQPRVPSRTGRAQLNDVVKVVERARREALTSRSGKVYLGGLQVKNTGDKRWCNKCDCEKPDRAHHCSSCGICVLRMDHHCPWLASKCIGLRNHKAFFLFLCYTSVLCSFVAQDMIRILIEYVDQEPDVSALYKFEVGNALLTYHLCKGFETSPVSWAILAFIGFIFGLALLPFAAYHAYLISRNRTTLESMEGAGRVRISLSPTPSAPRRDDVSDRLRRLAGSNMPPTRRDDEEVWKTDEQLTREERRILQKANKFNIYNVGIKKNWRAVMGKDWRKWFIPLGEPESDGYAYHINTDNLQRLEEVTASIRGGGVLPNSNSLNSRSKAVSSFANDDRSLSSIRGKARNGIPSHAASSQSRPPKNRITSAHGVVEWGAPPKKDFVLYGLHDDDVDSGGVLQGKQSKDDGNNNTTSRSQHGIQMDADIWS